MIEYNELEEILEKLTVNELEQVKNSLLELSKENRVIHKLDDYEYIIKRDYEFLKNIINKEFVNEYTDLYINLGIFRYGTYGLGELINKVIIDKSHKKAFRDIKFEELQYKIVDWGRSKAINDPKSQFLKVVEELGEIQLAKSEEEFMDAIGDTFVTLIILNDILQRLVKEDDDVTILTTDAFSEKELQEYSKQKTETDILGLLAYHINTDITKELGRIAGYISKMTEDNKSYYVEKIRLHILEVVKYVIYFSRSTNTDYIECLQLAYDTIANRKGKTIDGVFVKEEDL